jgi:hypothetical protein
MYKYLHIVLGALCAPMCVKIGKTFKKFSTHRKNPVKTDKPYTDTPQFFNGIHWYKGGGWLKTLGSMGAVLVGWWLVDLSASRTSHDRFMAGRQGTRQAGGHACIHYQTWEQAGRRCT